MKRLILLLAAVALAVLTPMPANAALTQTPSASASFSDSVTAIAYSGGVYYVGGRFTQSTTKDGDRRERSYLAAVDTDGDLRGFAPELNGPVTALASDGTYLYVSGGFSEVDGQPMHRLARFNMSTGDLDADYRVNLSAPASTLAVSGKRLYMGGTFTSVNGEARGRAAAVGLVHGGLVSGFTPQLSDGSVRHLEAAGSRIYASGTFNTVNGKTVRKLVALNRDTGAVDSGFHTDFNVVVYDVDVVGSRVYVVAGGSGGRVVALSSSGAEQWTRMTDGDVVAVQERDGQVYAGGHFERACKGTQVGTHGACTQGVYADRGKLLSVGTSGTVSDWSPDADSVVGVRAIASGSGSIAVGGDFLTFDGGQHKQRGFALFHT
ncbi:MAG TPA: hypothetical protein VE172_18400 [Stackebrandtia sp.]|jgi:hypothetical protein|uniref:hypothetical protein n=1 Tax=Stackebrandtia sp. TaxID=2023065 RepID=UPI002D68ECC4|nr:hypothetical protein [Stackebrandtia sp.]HZE40777.1 hypothetical protein [Stackebrandtia sp.]